VYYGIRKNMPLDPILSHMNPVHLLPELSSGTFATKCDNYTTAPWCVKPQQTRAALLQGGISIKVEVKLHCASYPLHLTTGTVQEMPSFTSKIYCYHILDRFSQKFTWYFKIDHVPFLPRVVPNIFILTLFSLH
jgi:hypothetical protein